MLSPSGSGTKGWNLEEREGEGAERSRGEGRGGERGIMGREGVMRRKERREEGAWRRLCAAVQRSAPWQVSPGCGVQVGPDCELEGHDEGNVDQEL